MPDKTPEERIKNLEKRVRELEELTEEMQRKIRYIENRK